MARRLHYLLLVAVALAGAACKTSRSPTGPGPADARRELIGLSTHTIRHDERDRYYLLYVPEGVVMSRRTAPLIVALHGEGQTPYDMVLLTGFNLLADQNNFVVVYPAGTGANLQRLYWNILLSRTYATANQVNDIDFLSVVLEKVQSDIAIDPVAIYAAGFSQGAMLCYRLACDETWSSRLAAIAPVAGAMTVAANECRASRPIPIISFHGQSDPFNNFHGGIGEKASRSDRVARPGVPETIAFWVAMGGMTNVANTSDSRGSAISRRYGPTESGFEVISWEIRDGGALMAWQPLAVAGMDDGSPCVGSSSQCPDLGIF